MPQKNIDGEWVGSYQPNLSAWARRLDDMQMTNEEKRRFLLENHEETHAFVLDAIAIVNADTMRLRFTEWLDKVPSIETFSRVVRKIKTNGKPRRKPDGPVGLDPPWYPQYLCTAHWAQVVQRAKNYYGSCVLCNVSRELVVHHRHYGRLGREEMQDVSVLCADCHRKVTRSVLPSLRVPRSPPPEVRPLLK